MRRSLGVLLAIFGALVITAGAGAQVLRVGRYHAIKGQFNTIQGAVDAAKPGDWILVGPGDFHERADHRASRGPQPSDTPAGVVIAKRDLHLRGMNRNRVVLDGTSPGSTRCSSAASNQDFGVPGPDGNALGRNGILVWKADGVTIDNLTTCNFLNGAGRVGNEIWWNGGDGGGQIGGHNYSGSYLTATSTFYRDPDTAAQYGIFSSDWSGGDWSHMYASNMSDSDFYVGGCQQLCDQTLDQVHAQHSVQGFSGTNAGGALVIENSEFDDNKTGIAAGALNNDDWPSPQDGACPNQGTSSITHTYSCFVVMNDNVHDNNDPNVPGAGIAAIAPVGTGVLLYGGRDNTITDNVIANNGAWGVVLVTYPDDETAPADVVAAGADCRGGIRVGSPSSLCLYDDWGNAILANAFQHNGFYGNDSNSDIGEVTISSAPTNCFHGNFAAGGGQVTSSPSGLQQSKPVCDGHNVPPDPNGSMSNQLLCDTQALSTPCPPGASYPQSTGVTMPALPPHLATMPHPCGSVPVDPWCSGQVTRVRGCAARFVKVPLPLAIKERLLSATVKIGRNTANRKLNGRKRAILIDLGKRRHRDVAAKLIERITVGAHKEKVVFTRIYHRC